MKSLLKISAYFLAFSFVLIACQKENVDNIVLGPAQYEIDTVDVNPLLKQMQTYSSDTIYIDCIKIAFPVNLLAASGKVLTIQNDSALQVAINSTDSIVDFVYPFQAFGPNGALVFNDITELVLGLQDCNSSVVTCADLDPHVLLFFNSLNILTINKYEYSINYPVTIIVENNPVVLTKNDDYLPAIGGSPFNYKETELVYPITVNQFGQTITLNNDNDVCVFYESLDEACGVKPAHIDFFFNEGAGTAINCTYFIDYPLSVTDANGNLVQIQKRSDYINLLNASPSSYAGINLVYPVRAQRYTNSQLITFNSGADLCQYLNNCQ